MTDFLAGVRNGEHKVWNKDGVLLVHEWYKDGERYVVSVSGFTFLKLWH